MIGVENFIFAMERRCYGGVKMSNGMMFLAVMGVEMAPLIALASVDPNVSL